MWRQHQSTMHQACIRSRRAETETRTKFNNVVRNSTESYGPGSFVNITSGTSPSFQFGQWAGHVARRCWSGERASMLILVAGHRHWSDPVYRLSNCARYPFRQHPYKRNRFIERRCQSLLIISTNRNDDVWITRITSLGGTLHVPAVVCPHLSDLCQGLLQDTRH